MDKKLGKNLIMSMGYKVLTIIVPFIIAPYLTRVLGADSLGSYTYVQSIATYFFMFSILGMQTYGNRTIARVREDRKKRSEVFWQLFSVQCLTGLIALIAYIIFLLLFDIEYKNLSIIVSLYVFSAFFSIDWFFEGMEQFTSIAVRTLIIKLANLLCVFIFVREQNDIVPYCIVMSLGYLISALLLWPLLRKYIDFIKPDFKDILKHIKPNLLLFLPSIASSVYQIMDKIMIGALSTEAQLAYYDYAEKIMQIPLMLFVSIGTVMLSRMSNIFQGESKKANDIICYSMDISFIMSTACGFGIFAIAKELVKVYYGINFTASGSILMALTPMVIMYGWSNVLRMQYIIPQNMDSVYIKATFAGAFVNLICNAVLIPSLQAYGATIGTVVSNFVVAFIFTVYVKKHLPIKKYIKRNIPLFFIGIIMLFSIKCFQLIHDENIIGLVLDVLFGGLIYISCLIIFGKISNNHFVSNIVKKKIER